MLGVGGIHALPSRRKQSRDARGKQRHDGVDRIAYDAADTMEGAIMDQVKTVEHRSLGGLPVSAIGLGCMSLSGIYGTANDTESEELIRYAIDQGIDHLDSSDMYGWGHNEQVIGRALKGRRDRVVLASKFGQTQNPGGPNGVDGRPEYSSSRPARPA